MEYKDLVEQTMIESLLWILGICGGVILLLLGIVGYFLKENLGAVYGLTKTVGELDKTLAVFQSAYNESTEVTKKRLDAHANQIDVIAARTEKHDAYIEVIRSRMKINNEGV